ncbi:MAG: THUMP domain-containing class I SAM-dependent RNA methyltransferase [Candidatus Heteroscillospira sp.]|jgi:putative N6-adenine-specific DNA methylase
MMEFIMPCLFGLEGPLANELRRMQLQNVRAENGRVRFSGSFEDMAKANIRSRFGERVLIELASFEARSFEELFQGTLRTNWEDFIPKDGAFPVKGHSLNSQLHSVPDCQKIIKKAVVERLKSKYGVSWFAETGQMYQIQFSIMKDQVSLCLDTSGAGLHKRGYRPAHLAAPLRETLAAAMVDFARYRGKGDFADPFCGSGTIAIEAALMAKNRAPGLYRSFSADKWGCVESALWRRVREEAIDREFRGEYHIIASDIDPVAVEISQKNAARAHVEDCIDFRLADAVTFGGRTENGVIVTNPPYGERLLDRQGAEELYRDFGRTYKGLENWRLFLLSSHPEFEHYFGKKAVKKRKLYNGMIKCELFMY